MIEMTKIKWDDLPDVIKNRVDKPGDMVSLKMYFVDGEGFYIRVDAVDGDD